MTTDHPSTQHSSLFINPKTKKIPKYLNQPTLCWWTNC